MATRPPPTPRPPRDPCVAPRELTAFAAGELDDATRAAISRHVLRCPRCRATRDGAASVLGRLAALGASATGQDDLVAARTARRAEGVRWRRASGLGAAAAAVLALGLFLPAEPPRSEGRLEAVATRDLAAGPAPSSASRALDAAAEASLLRAQASDGRWSAGTAAPDEATTGLAVLALLTDRPHALDTPTVARAVADATRWLRTNRGREGLLGAAGRSGARARAVGTAALLEVYAATRDAGLAADLRPAVRRLAEEAEGGWAADDAAGPWARRALARAESLGWRTRRDPMPDTARPVEAAWPMPGASSACGSVLAVLAR